MNRIRQPHELVGAPSLLAHVPDPDLLHEAGAPSTAKAIKKALELRDRTREAKQALGDAEQALRKAELLDRSEHACAVTRSRSATLEPKHTEAAKRAFEEAERRYDALCEAVETAADELLETGTAEAEQLLEGARMVRERSVARVERAAEEIERAVADQQAATSVARWAQDPSRRKWRVALHSGEVSRPAIRIDRLIAGNAALAPWLAQQPMPDEEEEQPKVYFG